MSQDGTLYGCTTPACGTTALRAETVNFSDLHALAEWAGYGKTCPHVHREL